MPSNSQPFKAIGILMVIIAIGVGLGWWVGKKKSPPAPQAIESSTEVTTEPGSNFVLTQPRHPPAAQADNNTVIEPIPTLIETNHDWEEKISEILGNADIDVTNQAKQLLELFPKLPETGQIEAAKHLANLVTDEDYAPLAKILTDAKMPAEVSETLLDDLVNRPNSLKLPLILEVARNPDHPQASQAQELLKLFLEEDYGTDWNQWEVKIKDWLKENSD